MIFFTSKFALFHWFSSGKQRKEGENIGRARARGGGGVGRKRAEQWRKVLLANNFFIINSVHLLDRPCCLIRDLLLIPIIRPISNTSWRTRPGGAFFLDYYSSMLATYFLPLHSSPNVHGKLELAFSQCSWKVGTWKRPGP
jgi:hypothetical protein